MAQVSDDRYAKFFFGENVETGTFLMMLYAALVIVVVGGTFSWMW